MVDTNIASEIEAYFANLPPEARTRYDELRSIVVALAPGVEEVISYGMPQFRYQGRPIAHFGAWKSHCALYGMNIAQYGAELAPYETAKGTIRFALDEPLPEPLIRALVSTHIADNEAKGRG